MIGKEKITYLFATVCMCVLLNGVCSSSTTESSPSSTANTANSDGASRTSATESSPSSTAKTTVSVCPLISTKPTNKSKPCSNGGTHYAGRPDCVCPPCFTGTFCENALCKPDTCSTHGTCSYNHTLMKLQCDCHDGFMDSDCSVDCSTDPCGIHGKCTVKDHKQYCNCTDGWGGKHCDHPCNINCEHGGKCYYDTETDSASCKCPPTAFGPKCERSLVCYKCVTTDGQDCIGTCHGAYCVTKRYEDTNIIQKGCSPVDPFVKYGFKSPKCADVVDMNDHGRFVYTCSCGDRNWCNESSQLSFSIFILFLSICISFYIKNVEYYMQ